MFWARGRKASRRKPQDAAASAYSRDRLVSNTPGSSVAMANGWRAPCTFVKWCRAAADAADIFTVGASSCDDPDGVDGAAAAGRARRGPGRRALPRRGEQPAAH